jgi:hypothetical protein
VVKPVMLYPTARWRKSAISRHDLQHEPFPPGTERVRRVGNGGAVGQQVVEIVRMEFRGSEIQNRH